jgi:D-glycero-alpha-D-manno-heptose-7-phosphate kinase
MKIVARAPVRIDPAGAGTDAPPYAIEYGGCVVNLAVARYSYAQLQWLEPGAGVHLCSLDLKERAWAPHVDALERDGTLDFVKAFARRLLKGRNDFLLVTQSDVPVRTGLGGSGAMGVAITTACVRAIERSIAPADIALLANEIERKDLGLAGGSQDSYGSAIGGAKQIIYHRGGRSECRRLVLRPAFINCLERDLLLIYTGAIHLSGSIHADIRTSYALENSPTIAAMDGLRAAAYRMAGALEAGNLDGFIEALNASRRHHYALHESCDSDVLRRFFSELDPFILGGKTCGAGGGGFIVVCARAGRRSRCIEVAETLGGTVWPFKMDLDGVLAWREPVWTPDVVEQLTTQFGT